MQNDSQFSLKHFDTPAKEEEDPTSSMAFRLYSACFVHVSLLYISIH
jgi:hypothetical protein